MRKSVILGGMLVGLTTALGASAQDAAAQTSGQANVGMSLPGATPATATGASDHDQMVGRLAVGYFGITQVGAGANLGTGSNDTTYAITGFAPVIGVRYWINQMLGLDVGLGLSIVGGSTSTDLPAPAADIDNDRDSFTGFVIHGGVPLALASVDHFTFEVVPEANVAITSAGTDTNGPAAGDLSHSGFHFDVGARAGAELHFGFIKVPQLSLQASVGLRFDVDSGKTTDSTGPGADVESSSSRTELHSTVQSAPWAIFTNNIAALYYF